MKKIDLRFSDPNFLQMFPIESYTTKPKIFWKFLYMAEQWTTQGENMSGSITFYWFPCGLTHSIRLPKRNIFVFFKCTGSQKFAYLRSFQDHSNHIIGQIPNKSSEDAKFYFFIWKRLKFPFFSYITGPKTSCLTLSIFDLNLQLKKIFFQICLKISVFM